MQIASAGAANNATGVSAARVLGYEYQMIRSNPWTGCSLRRSISARPRINPRNANLSSPHAEDFAPAGEIYLRLVATEASDVFRLVPTAVRPVMITTAIRAAINPYSMAVAPSVYLVNFFHQRDHRKTLFAIPGRACGQEALTESSAG